MEALGSTQLRMIRDLPLLSETEFEALIKRRDAGDPEAIHLIALHNMRLGYSQVAKTMTQMSYHKTGDLDADDIWQEVYLSLIEAAKSYDPAKGKFSTYAYQFISNKCYTILHKWERNVRGQAIDMEKQGNMFKWEPANESEMQGVDENADSSKLLEEFQRALRQLDQNEYLALALLYGFGGSPMKQKEVAEHMRISVTTLKGIVLRSFRKIRWLVVTATNGYRPAYPLLLKYWAEADSAALLVMMTPIFIEEDIAIFG